ncbi:MAG: 50S ribosomal protein L6 [Candidatus Aminicenantes bacterium RBG_13_63_10]|nr:MAG: 50S ribosomal protein L6 [Candidatus Aminicenantes bacterium RBG_13_63_10]
MSRIGKLAIVMPQGVKVKIGPDKLEIEGPKGKLTSPLFPGITARVEDNKIWLTRADETKQRRSLHGLSRTLANNAVVGVSQGFSKQLEIVGVGYRAKMDKGQLELSLGYSKPVVFPVPKDIEILVDKTTLVTVKGIDKQRVGQVAEEIKNIRRPDPYKLKGVRHVGERLIKKERKAGVSGA